MGLFRTYAKISIYRRIFNAVMGMVRGRSAQRGAARGRRVRT